MASRCCSSTEPHCSSPQHGDCCLHLQEKKTREKGTRGHWVKDILAHFVLLFKNNTPKQNRQECRERQCTDKLQNSTPGCQYGGKKDCTQKFKIQAFFHSAPVQREKPEGWNICACFFLHWEWFKIKEINSCILLFSKVPRFSFLKYFTYIYIYIRFFYIK